jgi:cholesterol transport system auxiliary component
VTTWLALLASLTLSACVSVGLGGDVPSQAHYLLHDDGAPAARRAEALVPALLIQPLPADATADTVSLAYSQRPNEFAYYQFAAWTERPVRQVPRLLQHRLEARGVAGAVGVIGEPLRADWLLTIAVDTLHHDVSVPPGQGRVALTAELFDRRSRTRIARRRFDAAMPTASADAPAAAAALSQSLAQVFDQLVPWLESELQQAGAKAPK